MFLSQKAQYLLLVVLVTYANAGMVQNFIRSFTGSFQTASEPNSPAEDFKGNLSLSQGNLSLSEGWERGYHSHEPHYETHHSYYKQDQNLDLYSLLAGLSFASLLGAAIIFLASNRTIGRRRRSLDEDSDSWDHITDAIEDPLWEKAKVQTIKLY